MTWFTVDTRYTDDAAALDRARPAHRDYLSGLAERGVVLAGGPWADGLGGMFVVKAADRAEVDAILAADPYTSAGVAAERTVREWRIVLGPWA